MVNDPALIITLMVVFVHVCNTKNHSFLNIKYDAGPISVDLLYNSTDRPTHIANTCYLIVCIEECIFHYNKNTNVFNESIIISKPNSNCLF